VETSDANVWQRVLIHLEAAISPEDFRRWFSATAYASASGDQITVWVPSEGIRRHLEMHYHEALREALIAVSRSGTAVRFIAAGLGDEDDDE
jgi:chromosomal replication initiation ATPase DnaA